MQDESALIPFEKDLRWVFFMTTKVSSIYLSQILGSMSLAHDHGSIEVRH